jgi:anti-sigma-K factor RskA
MHDQREHVIDDLGAHALGALDEAARARVQSHLDGCEACAAELAEMQGVLGVLPVALPPVSPPPEAWTAIRAAARAPRRGRAAPRAWPRLLAWPAAAGLVAILLLWNVSLQREVLRHAQGPQIEKLARRPARLVILAGTSGPQASARLFAAVDGRSGHMAVSGLAPLPSGRVYTLWFLGINAPPVSGATFTVDGEGRAWVVVRVPLPLEETRAILVTEEPRDGSASPTGPALLEARTWR